MKGHVIMGAEAIVHVVVALLVGQLWWKTKYYNDTLNPWYNYAWQAMQAGAVVSSGLQAIMFPLTFANLNLFERLGWVALWLVNGFVFGTWTTITVLAYFLVAAAKYETDPDLSVKNLWITFVIYLAF